MSLTFENPWWLLVILLAAPALVTGLRWFGTMSRLRAWSAIVLRSILLALIASILAGASAVRTTDRLAVIAVVDVSDSVRQFAAAGSGGAIQGAPSEALRQWILDAINDPARGPDDLLGVVVFDGDAVAAAMPRPIGRNPTGSAAGGTVADFSLDWRLAEGTNIEQAIRLAAAMFPPDAARRLVLLSDGVETAGDALGAAAELAGGGLSAAGDRRSALSIDVVPLSYSVENEVMVEAVDVPPQAATGSTVAVRVSLLATQETAGTIELLYEERPVDLNGPQAPGAGQRITLPPGRSVIELDVPLDESRPVHRMRPVFTPERPELDRIASNNIAEAFTVTPGKGQLLVIDGVGDARPGSAGLTLPRTLANAGMDVVTLSPAEAPIDVLSLQAYDLVILQNVAAEEIPRGAHKALADYVSELGGGLVMVGGPDSFGAGGWNGADLEPVLPVELDLPEQLLAPSAAVAIVLDNSGSMFQSVAGGLRTQQEVANQGAALAIETLDRTDYVTVIAFNSSYTVVVPMGRNSDPQLSATRVRNIGTGGGTNLYPALEHAGHLLSTGEAARASVRHIIVLSDGRSEGTIDEGIAIAETLHRRGITVSTIAVGDQADTQGLSTIAQHGGGQFYEVIDPFTLPRVFIREIRVVRKPLIRETPFRPVDLRSGSRLLAGVDGPIPPLGGLVLTQRRDDPKINYALATPEGDPVLAHWFVGRGQVAAFTSDAHRWAEQWLAWPGYSAMWTNIARTIARPASERSSELLAEIVDGELVIRLDASDDNGRPMDLLTVPGTVYLPDGGSVPVQLAQIGPGVYETRLRAPARGNYVVALTPRQGERALPTIVGGASRALGEEFRSLRSNIGLLRRLAEETGGRVLDLALPEEARLFERRDVEPARAASPIWRILLVWAVVIFLLDVATRRVAWDRLVSRELALTLREQAAAARRARAEKAAATVAALRAAAEGSADAASPHPGSRTQATPAGRPAASEGTSGEAGVPRARRWFGAGRSPDEPRVDPLKPVELDEEAQAERRRRLRAQMLERLEQQRASAEGRSGQGDGGGTGRTGKGDSPAKPAREEEAGGAEAGESPTSGLLEAKRRARARFEKDKPGT